MIKKNVVVFCASSPHVDIKWKTWAFELGQKIADQGLNLVYGGASIGLMGALADGALSRGGQVIGVMPQHLAEWEVAHKGLTELKLVGSMHERKQMMYDLADVFLTLPGGMGTLDELFEVLTWAQLKRHDRSVYLINYEDYYQGLLIQMKKMLQHGILKQTHYDLLQVLPSEEHFFQRMS